MDETSAYALVPAAQGRFGDNILRADQDAFLEALLTMGRDGGGESGWGAIDRTRLDELVARGREGDLAAIETLYGMFPVRPINKPRPSRKHRQAGVQPHVFVRRPIYFLYPGDGHLPGFGQGYGSAAVAGIESFFLLNSNKGPVFGLVWRIQ